MSALGFQEAETAAATRLVAFVQMALAVVPADDPAYRTLLCLGQALLRVKHGRLTLGTLQHLLRAGTA